MKGLTLFTIFLILIYSCDETVTSTSSKQSEKATIDTLQMYYNNGNIEVCIRKSIEFIFQHPKNDVGWQILGAAHLLNGEDSLAESCSMRAISLNSSNTSAIVNYAIILDKKEKYSEAEVYYKKAIKLNPNLVQAYSNYASNRACVLDYDGAVINGEKAVALTGKISDKGILCAAYHKAKMFKKRDSLFHELDELNYQYLEKLRGIIDNN